MEGSVSSLKKTYFTKSYEYITDHVEDIDWSKNFQIKLRKKIKNPLRLRNPEEPSRTEEPVEPRKVPYGICGIKILKF